MYVRRKRERERERDPLQCVCCSLHTRHWPSLLMCLWCGVVCVFVCKTEARCGRRSGLGVGRSRDERCAERLGRQGLLCWCSAVSSGSAALSTSVFGASPATDFLS